MKTRLAVLSCCVALAAMLAHTQSADEGYQTGKVLAIERVAADAKHMENQDNYKISMRLGDTIYKCTANAPAAVFLNWTTGKEFPTKLNDKVLLVKNSDGQMVELKITGKKTVK